MLRRHFLRAIAGSAVLPFLPAARARAAEELASGIRIEPVSQRLVALLQTPSARAIGARALACGACESDPLRLAAALVETLPERVDQIGSDALRLMVDERIREDFAKGHSVSVDGWILSRTEVRLCALRSVLPA